MELSSRQQKILAAVVEHYIATGEPAGSKMLCDSLDFTVSPATVRNEMSELAERGLLLQPHTSAGRIPSQKGYRVYVDRLMKRRPLSPEERRTIDSMLLSNAYDPQKLLDGVSRLLAGMTRFAAVSTLPGGQGVTIRAVQFVQTSRRTAMVVLITSSGISSTPVNRQLLALDGLPNTLEPMVLNLSGSFNSPEKSQPQNTLLLNTTKSLGKDNSPLKWLSWNAASPMVTIPSCSVRVPSKPHEAKAVSGIAVTPCGILRLPVTFLQL